MTTTSDQRLPHGGKVLFVCARNRIRSLTAEKLFAGSGLYHVRSRGVAPSARIRLGATDISWADIVFVMEKNHKTLLAQKFPEQATAVPVVCLFIKDIYTPMQPELLAVLRASLAPHLRLP